MTGALPFSCVPHDHPVYPDVERFWELARDDPSYSRLAAEGLYVRSLLRARLVRGAWEFRRLYVSFQSPRGAPSFAAHTFRYSPGRSASGGSPPSRPSFDTSGLRPGPSR